MDFLQKDHRNFKSGFLSRELFRDEAFKSVSDVFSLLADSNRLKIFWLLCHSRDSVQNIAAMMNMTTPAVSHHLKLLREASLVEAYRDGREVFYSAAKTKEGGELHVMIEKMMLIACPDFDRLHESRDSFSQYIDDQGAKIRKVHDFLKENLSSRITIEEIAKKFAMNPTTLKTAFKDVYSSSIAAHIKEHRMEKAAELLAKTDLSVGDVAVNVGYESQSKFGAAFKEFYGVSPVEYRKSCAGAK